MPGIFLNRTRLVRLDVLRGIAIVGILFVNIWTFVWGAGPLRFGVLPEAASLADSLAVFATAFLAEHKSYPTLAFLFGAGFALHGQKLRREHGVGPTLQRALRRRPAWLLGCGVLHGTLIWYGDILWLYGVAGILLARAAAAPLAEVRASLWRWAAVALLVALLAALPMIAPLIAYDPQQVAQASGDAQMAEAVRRLNTQGSLAAFALKRLADYGQGVLFMSFMVPHVMVLFLFGTLAARLGWLTRPWRHGRMWRRVRRIGLLLGIPLNLLWAALSLAQAADPARPLPGLMLMFGVMMLAGPCLAAAGLASLMLAGESSVRRMALWLAPVGRMALTNYLLQSVLCLLLLQTPGLGLGAWLAPAGLTLLAAAIAVLQMLASRWWLAHYRQGPVEALYRRFADRN